MKDTDNKHYGLLIDSYGDKKKSIFPDYNLQDNDSFLGGYLNLGYWANVSCAEVITPQQRINASKDLYSFVGSSLSISHKDKILEMGSGRGCGARFILDSFGPAQLDGLDIVPWQIDLANAKHSSDSENGKIQFFCGDICDTSFCDQSYKGIYSVEVAQHISNVNTYLREVYRLLSIGGRFCFAAHLSTTQEGKGSLFDSGYYSNEIMQLDVFPAVTEFLDGMKKLGFKKIVCRSIGEDVFPGFNAWTNQMRLGNMWTKHIYNAFKNGIVDYYVISATK